jgi:hypothetical protein
MSEQTAESRARQAEERGRKQQRQAVRDAIRADAELRREIVADLREDLREVVADEQVRQLNELLRQSREERLAQAIERQAEARRRAPRQVSLDSGLNLTSQGNGGTRVISRGYDLEHSPEFMRAIQDGKGYPQALALAREAHPPQAARRWQPGTGGGSSDDRTGSPYAGSTADAYAYRTESPDILWETRNGQLKAGPSAMQLPGLAAGESWHGAPLPPEEIDALRRGDRPGSDSWTNRGI